jgi:hypothetical protein
MVRLSLVASGNTYNPSLIVLRQKGYDVWLEKGDDATLWCARKGATRFSPIQDRNCSAWSSCGSS